MLLDIDCLMYIISINIINTYIYICVCIWKYDVNKYIYAYIQGVSWKYENYIQVSNFPDTPCTY